eukprot:TRINITY_DN1837_c0_g2_i2.p3 TRINITY_DN1837_c0_g2~~TRINITY_DN1837_c0_g2_i2.p3  ORF type:complete len:101 (-),score=18.60 TRINITY_DN1837_c0_g2_i2:41-343(-)
MLVELFRSPEGRFTPDADQQQQPECDWSDGKDAELIDGIGAHSNVLFDHVSDLQPPDSFYFALFVVFQCLFKFFHRAGRDKQYILFNDDNELRQMRLVSV